LDCPPPPPCCSDHRGHGCPRLPHRVDWGERPPGLVDVDHEPLDPTRQARWGDSPNRLWRADLQVGDQGPAAKGLQTRLFGGVSTRCGIEGRSRTDRAAGGEVNIRRSSSQVVSSRLLGCFERVQRVDRRSIATATKQFAPALYRTAKCAYNSPSELIVGDVRLSSSQGVRQGDPLGPLLFSLGLRPTFKALSTHLGPNRMVVAYLDDIFILSDDDSAMTDAQAFLSSHTEIIRLNASKCRTLSLDSIRQDGLELLGTVVGPPATRPGERSVSSRISVTYNEL